MVEIVNKLFSFIHIPFSDDEIGLISEDEVRRIRMVNYIGVISMLTMLSYILLYAILDYNLLKPAIWFLSIGVSVIIGIIIINRLGYYNLGKILMALVNPFFMSGVVLFIFGNKPEFQIFLLLSAFVPLFLWSIKKPALLLFFIVLNVAIYIVIEFFAIEAKISVELPEKYIEWFHSTNVLVCFFGAGIAIAVYVILADKKEEKLVLQTKELEKSQQHRDFIYSVIAHDLRSPFNGFLGLTSLLVEDYDQLDDENRKKYVKLIYDLSNSLNSLLENLLGWSKMQSGKLILDLQTIQLKSVVNEIIKLLSGIIEKKNIQITNNIDDKIEVIADKYLISSVIRNLTTNALKFTSTNGVITIFSTIKNDKVELCIKDTGIGIPEKYITNLFDLSSKYMAQGTNSEKGSGLGLKLCKDFVHAMGGDIWVKSKVNKGTEFYFTVPQNI